MKKARWPAALVAALLCAGTASAQQMWFEKYRMKTPDTKFFEYLQRLSFNGDLRLRHDVSAKRGPGLNGRNRLRYRLRLGMEALLPWELSVNARLASGTGEQVSTNQSADNLSSQKGIYIDQAYLRWSPIVSQEGDGSFYLQAGRMPNCLWRLYSSDLLWDDDWNPEGFGEGIEWLLPPGFTVFANAMQVVADEDSNSGKDQWLFSQQVGGETRLPFDTRFKAAAAYHSWSDVNRSSLGAAAVQDGNRRVGGVLANRFGVLELTGQLSGWFRQTPVRLQATLARNVRSVGLDGTAACAAANTCPSARDGYQYGAIIGEAKMPGTWEAAYFQKYSQTDVTVADAADSDFGDGGTNQQGQIAWLAYAPAEWMVFKAKYFNVDTIDTQFLPDNKAVRRYQGDVSLKF
ncbi:MAG: putative porin [Elusimicrobia bacterium]|nr:putative porin [Elusimicrobiota bacterium]